MKHELDKKRIMVFGDSNTFGWVVDEKGRGRRMPISRTWPMVMQEALGPQAEVVIEALTGRTTEVDRALGAGSGRVEGVSMNGAGYLPAALSSQMPLDLVVIMLGSNDMNAVLNRTAEDVAASLVKLTRIVRDAKWQSDTDYPAPEVLIVTPPYMDMQDTPTAAQYEGSLEKTQRLAAVTKPVVEAAGASFFDAASVVPYARQPDKLHLTEDQQAILGKAVARVVAGILDLPVLQ